MTLDPYNAFLHRVEEEGDWRVAVKDVIDVAGMPTTAASKVLYRVPDRDAECVARLRAAGATIVGKLNTHEFAFGAITNSPHFGPALNPWDPTRMTGGSSGGSGAAVAAGLVDVALGTDTAGSVRIPAAFCGVTGHRPTAGPRADRRRRPHRVDASTRSARSPAAPRSAGAPSRSWPDVRSSRGPTIRRIGVVTRLFEQADSGIAAVCAGGRARSRATWRRAGRAAAARGDRDDHAARDAPRGCGGPRHWLRTRLADYGPDVRARALAGLLLPSTAYVTGLQGTELGPRAVGARAGGLRPARRAGDAEGRAAPGRDPVRLPAAIMPYNSPASLLGLPVTNVPCGFVDGLPVGLVADRPPR